MRVKLVHSKGVQIYNDVISTLIENNVVVVKIKFLDETFTAEYRLEDIREMRIEN